MAVKVVPVNITERLWCNNTAQERIDVYKISDDLSKTLLKSYIPTVVSMTSYVDISMPNENCYILACSIINDKIADSVSYKVGSPVKEFIFSINRLTSGNKLFVSKPDGTYLATFTGNFLDLRLFDGTDNVIYDVTSLPDNNYMISLEFEDFKRYKKPAIIENMQLNIQEGKIIIQPGFNLIAWQGGGNGCFADKKNASIISDVANCIAVQLNNLYGTASWRGCRTYDEKNGVFLDYINGVTPDDATGNFKLVVSDGGNREVKGIEFFSLNVTEMELEYF